MKKSFVAFLILLTFTIVSCIHSNPWTRKPANGPDVLEGFANYSEFQSMLSDPSKGEYIKFVVVKDANPWKIYFFNDRKYPLHTAFVIGHLKSTLSTDDIYLKAHYNTNRSYFFGAVTSSRSNIFGNNKSIQITAKDPLSMEDTIKVFKLAESKIPKNYKLDYLPSGNQAEFVFKQENLSTLEAQGVPVATRDVKENDFYAKGYSVGRLKIVSASEIESGTYKPKKDDILVLDYIPITQPPVRGVISSTPSSPNSHVSLLAV